MVDMEERGFIPAPELRAKLTRLGEKLTDREDEGGCTHIDTHAYTTIRGLSCYWPLSVSVSLWLD